MPRCWSWLLSIANIGGHPQRAAEEPFDILKKPCYTSIALLVCSLHRAQARCKCFGSDSLHIGQCGREVSVDGDHILAIDNGTQSVRALLFDPTGTLVAKSLVPLEPYYSEQPGWTEQRPAYYWESLCQACQQLWRAMDLPKDIPT